MRRIQVPNSSPAHEFGVELDKVLADGTKAIGIVSVTDNVSPFKADEIILHINAWQVNPDGTLVTSPTASSLDRIAIRERLVSVPRSQYTYTVADAQIDLAAAALNDIAVDPATLVQEVAINSVSQTSAMPVPVPVVTNV